MKPRFARVPRLRRRMVAHRGQRYGYAYDWVPASRRYRFMHMPLKAVLWQRQLRRLEPLRSGFALRWFWKHVDK